jgi:CheY-like chemotaxis protein
MSADNQTLTPTLLLADDSRTIQRVIELTFATENVHVVVVGDGDAAIASIEEQPPDIVLADVGMPGKTGYEVARHIKQSARLRHIPVVLLTGAFEPVDQDKANEAGCDGVLAKPFEPRLVIDRVSELLGRSRAVPGQAPVEPQPMSAALPMSAEPTAPANADGGSAAFESLENFFDKLDAAFASLPAAPRELAAPEQNPPHADASARGSRSLSPDLRAPLPAVTDAELDDTWAIETPRSPDGELPSFLAPHNDAADGVSGPPARSARSAAGSLPSASLEARAMPALAEAFAVLLAAEQPGAPPANVAAWAKPASPAATDELVERVAQLVLERLSDRVMRETTTTLVSSIAERLVREEIGRIRAAVKQL